MIVCNIFFQYTHEFISKLNNSKKTMGEGLKAAKESYG